MSLRPGDTLSHYRLGEKIGEGGMGVVWRAADLDLHRAVAIKVLPQEVSPDPARRRMFLDEARMAASLNHPRIVQVHELGNDRGIDFIVMEHVEGEPLAHRLRRGPLPAMEIIKLGCQMAEGLARAHRSGLIHRDLKPGNLLVTPEGEVKIVDFGLATLYREVAQAELGREAAAPGKVTTTDVEAPSRLMGTLPYMSPEQIRRRKLDGRTDIFSLGAVLYEMATGRPAFGGDTSREILRDVLQARPEPAFGSSVPEELKRIIGKAIAPRRRDRHATMEELASDLDRLGKALARGDSGPARQDRGFSLGSTRGALAALAVAAVAVGAWGAFSLTGGADGRTLVVMPFAVRDPEAAADYLGLALAESIALNLTESDELVVLDVPSGPEPLNTLASARQMHADRLVTGAITRDASGTRVTLKLLETRQGRLLWGIEESSADGSLAELGVALVRRLREYLQIASPRLQEYYLYLRPDGNLAASLVWNETLNAIRRRDRAVALSASERLIQEFPDDPDAMTLRAYAMFFADLYRQLDEPLRRLEQLDPANITAAVMRCDVTFVRSGDRPARLACLHGLLDRDDITPAARAWILRQQAIALREEDRFHAALEKTEKALRLDPASFYNYNVFGFIYLGMGELDAAEENYRKALALTPGASDTRATLAVLCEHSGRWAEAAQHYALSCAAEGDSTCSFQAFALWMAGRKVEAETLAERLWTDRSEGRSRPAPGGLNDVLERYRLSCLWALAGEWDRSASIRSDGPAEEITWFPERPLIARCPVPEVEAAFRDVSETGKP